MFKSNEQPGIASAKRLGDSYLAEAKSSGRQCIYRLATKCRAIFHRTYQNPAPRPLTATTARADKLGLAPHSPWNSAGALENVSVTESMAKTLSCKAGDPIYLFLLSDDFRRLHLSIRSPFQPNTPDLDKGVSFPSLWGLSMQYSKQSFKLDYRFIRKLHDGNVFRQA